MALLATMSLRTRRCVPMYNERRHTEAAGVAGVWLVAYCVHAPRR